GVLKRLSVRPLAIAVLSGGGCCMENGHIIPSECPPPAELAEFVTGNLSAKAFERIARHVERCSACATILGTLDDARASFLSRLRQAASKDVPPVESVPRGLLATARSVFSARSPEAPRRFGKFERLEELGLGSFGHVFRARRSR